MKLISIVLPDFSGGGAEKVMIALANAFQKQGYNVHLVVFNNTGNFVHSINERIKIINLSSNRAIFSIYPLLRYFNKNKPKIVLSALTHVNLISILAKTISQVKIRLVISEHAIVSEISKNTKQFSEKLYPILMRLLYILVILI